MKCFMTAFAILLASVAFGPSATTAKDPGGGQGRGHPGGGQQGGMHQGGGQQGAMHQGGGQQGGGHHLSGSTGVNLGAGANLGRPGGPGVNARPNVGDYLNQRFSVDVGVGATPESWRYRSENGRWWYWTPQNRWMWYSDGGRWMDYSADTYPDPTTPYGAARPLLENSLPAEDFSGGLIRITNPAANNVTLSYTLDGVAYTIAPGYSQDLREDRAWVIQFSRGTNLGQAQYGLHSGLYSFDSSNQGWELYRSELP